jgi:CCR4-NOT transcriptional regulation complex NOT5 subunit
MIIEKVRLKVALLCGSKTYSARDYSAPIPQDVLDEALSGSGLAVILESRPEPTPVIRIHRPGTGTSTSEVGTVSYNKNVEEKKTSISSTSTTVERKPRRVSRSARKKVK